jgi:hypothetical protein
MQYLFQLFLVQHHFTPSISPISAIFLICFSHLQLIL